MLALAAGASYVSPFVGRLDAIGEDGMQVINDIAQILRAQPQAGKIIAAALRHPVHIHNEGDDLAAAVQDVAPGEGEAVYMDSDRSDSTGPQDRAGRSCGRGRSDRV
jgi:hypothetical protein